MRRTQLIIALVTIAAAAAVLAPALAERAEERSAVPKGKDRGAPGSWPGIADGAGKKPEGTVIALHGDLAIADALRSTPLGTADAAIGARDGVLGLVSESGVPSVAAAEDAPGPRLVLEAPAGEGTLRIAVFATSAAAPDLSSLAEAVEAFDAAEPEALTVVYASASDPGGERAKARAGASRKLRRSGAEIVAWHGVDEVGAFSHHERRWIFYGLGSAKGAASLVLRLVVGADERGAPRAELRAYPLPIDGAGGGKPGRPRAASARDFGAAYNRLIVDSWAPEEHLLKRRIGFGFDDVGRHFHLGTVAIGGRP
ncbi:MAG: hypothetical protein M0R80_13125 [Proteobacteria bacterium]|jgi:hypothetical protein|nr:hypothetical protein [Pseudomonadota bacterium]